MKVVVFTPAELSSATSGEQWRVSLYADSSVMPTQRPLFLPDAVMPARCRVALAVRIGRLGKSIAREHAHRYPDAYSAAFITLPPSPMPDVLTSNFDGAVAIGVWQSIPADESTPTIDASAGDARWPDGWWQQAWSAVAQAIERSSRLMTLKTGDVLCLCSTLALPVAPGLTLQAIAAGREVLTVRVK